MSDPTAAKDFQFGSQNGFFLLDAQGHVGSTFFISGEPQTIATVDLTNDAAVSWFQSLLQRTLDFGYDGWMHDFGEYVQRSWTAHDGSSGEVLHNRFPVLSAKSAFEFLERVRPNDYLFFVRSGGSGTQQFVPAVWGGDAEATFDDTQGIPSALRSGLNLGMSGVPYWGSDGTGFKCLTNYPRDKEVYLRWAELMAVSPIMMHQNACSNPVHPGQTKWTLWSDDETTATYAAMARLHTRLQPYFEVLAQEAHDTGVPLMRHPFLTNPDEIRARDVDGAFFLGSSLFVAPVVRRGERIKTTWLPPGRYVDVDDGTIYLGDSDSDVDIDAPLDKLPLLLVENRLVPMLDSAIETLAEVPPDAPANPSYTSPVTPSMVADRLDVMAAIGPGGSAHMRLTDGTELAIEPTAQPNESDLVDGAGDGHDMQDCARCVARDAKGTTARLRANGSVAHQDEIVVDGLRLSSSGGPARRVRWTILRLP
jgi:alpha-glucosidase (family GH31 glycosyl hydrolase)